MLDMLKKLPQDALLISSLLLALTGCDETGPPGPPGPIGPEGPPGMSAPTPQDLRDLMECSANMPDPGALPDVDDDDVAPAPASIGADVPVSYFGPAPSDTNRNLIGPVQLLTSGQVDLEAGTVTLPLYEANVDGTTYWYILTDTTDEGNADALGLNHSPKLVYADTGRGVRSGYYDTSSGGVVLQIDGTDLGGEPTDVGVDFSPVRNVEPNIGAPFPPLGPGTQPGAVGGMSYSPLIRIENAGRHIYNAPIVARGTAEQLDGYCGDEVDDAGRMLIHDSVVHICPDPESLTVTIELVPGFSFGRPVLYLSTDANMAGPAALEGAVFAPGLQDVLVGNDDSAFSAVERLFFTVNGPQNDIAGEVNPQRQGLLSALRDEGGPLNVLGGIPTIATDYSPLWDVNFGEWTPEAIERGYRARVTEEFQILSLVERGHMTGPDGSNYGSSGIVVNCPIVQRLL